MNEQIHEQDASGRDFAHGIQYPANKVQEGLKRLQAEGKIDEKGADLIFWFFNYAQDNGLTLNGAEDERFDARLLDDGHSSEQVAWCDGRREFELQPYMVALLETPGIYMKPAVRKAEARTFAGQDAADAGGTNRPKRQVFQ